MGKSARVHVTGEHAPKGTVAIGIVSRGECKSHFARSLADVVSWDMQYGRRWLAHDKPMIWVIGGTVVANSRNNVVHQFLMSQAADWLVLIDDDQVFPPNLIEYLMEPADAVERPVIGIPVWRFTSKDDGPVRVTHNVFDVADNAFVEFEELPTDALVQVGAVGTGCMVIHRDVLLKLADFSHQTGNGSRWAWFRHNVYGGDISEGEDLFFARLCAAAGVPIFVNTSLTLGHLKTVILDGPVPEGLVTI